ncbi:potassium/sodium hyperpolarization-activated cyclic nucleotide-gated channel 4-like [Cylas formicarius]|uniref:potassium/sodium hyperpolarization-activated cyclic nucleotide-gated channel 4-like n=1 Tax=Cylas formicarius TaxID=197179 RepID=UPI002958794F|nr:potassium/sodium hyperpolarization-activated cyclic nucleotide-gated channel 4-like [Cylas formicarius]
MRSIIKDNRLEHNCTAHCERQFPPKRRTEPKWKYLLKKLYYCLSLVSGTHPQCNLYFASSHAFREEKRRHYDSNHYYIIHPLSKLAIYHEMYILALYVVAIWLKLLDVAFIRRTNYYLGTYSALPQAMNICDGLSWLNIMFMFFIGFVISENRLVVIEHESIVFFRLRSLMFWAELLSSIPRYTLCAGPLQCSHVFWNVLNFLSLFKIVLFGKLIRAVKICAQYFKIENTGLISLVQFFLIMVLVTHLMSCLEFGVPRFRKIFTGEYHPSSWILYDNLLEKSLVRQYFYAFFKTAAQTFGVHIDVYKEYATWEETMVTLVNYFVGKIIHITTWVALLCAILSKDLQEVKFQEIITQLHEYMKHKQLPDNLRHRIVGYYNFKYQRKFFNQRNILDLLPESLRFKVNIDKSRTIKSSKLPLFNAFSEDTLQEIVSYFVSEIYSANDVIIMSGSIGHCLYIIASGTVALYTHSGKEVCHLQDGAYFGELSLILKNQKCTSTIIAIETSKVYRLERKYFERYMVTNKELYAAILKQAEERLKMITEVEEEYRRYLFERTYTGTQL